jgi:uncharacterized protein (DUF1810 family)
VIPAEDDPFNLQRFVDAQGGGVYEQALAELQAGKKSSHWIWFIFPQHVDLGRSPTAKYYGLSGVEEAQAYLDHPLLGPRLVACCDAILLHLLNGTAARDILGDIDALKIGSSMEIFLRAEPEEYRFAEILEGGASCTRS